MLYYLFDYLDKHYQLSGAGLFQFISFRSAMAFVFSLLISTIFGRRIIDKLRRLQVGETVRDLGLDGQVQKAGTPTMGGIIVILATLIPVLLFAKLDNVYIIILVVSTVWMGLIGFIDDYIKVFKKNKDGLKGKFKVLGQVGLGVFVGLMLYFSPQVVIKEKINGPATVQTQEFQTTNPSALFGKETKSLKTTIPGVKNNEFDYSKLVSWMGDGYEKYAWIPFVKRRILSQESVPPKKE
ncbi:UNVERIFIED_CONTAM: hypothetical protein GTU68_000942 [Idotea baltica]|nr:hypothetical protein [Idotea baltica]